MYCVGYTEKLLAAHAVVVHAECIHRIEIIHMAQGVDVFAVHIHKDIVCHEFFLGLNIDKCEIGDRYLDKGEAGAVSYFEAFEGDPRDEDSYGCYAPVIVKAANRILKEKASELKAEEVTGGRLGSLFEYIDKDIPVIIWGTQNCQSGYISGQWRVDEQEFTWISPEHCMVLVGYSDSSVWVADPIHGDVREFDINTFEPCYNLLHKQAVVIR